VLPHNSELSVDRLGQVFSKQRRQLVRPIHDYLLSQNTQNTPNRKRSRYIGKLPVSSSLVLDGTGPRLTIQLPYLSAMGFDTINSFDHIFAFSGGVGAYCAYLAQVHGCLNHELSY